MLQDTLAHELRLFLDDARRTGHARHTHMAEHLQTCAISNPELLTALMLRLVDAHAAAASISHERSLRSRGVSPAPTEPYQDTFSDVGDPEPPMMTF